MLLNLLSSAGLYVCDITGVQPLIEKNDARYRRIRTRHYTHALHEGAAYSWQVSCYTRQNGVSVNVVKQGV